MPICRLCHRSLARFGAQGWLACLLGMWMLMWPAWAQAQQAYVQVLDKALVATESPSAPPQWAAADIVSLPDDWAAEGHASRSGVQWYRTALHLKPVVTVHGSPPTLFGLYIERACSVVQVWINGQLIHDGGRFTEPVTRHCHRPQLMSVPASLLRPEGNVLDVRVRGYGLNEVSSRQRVGGLSEIEFGPFDVMTAHHARRMAYAIHLPQVMSGVLLLMGSFMFVMGWFNRAQSYLAYFGALMVGWAALLARLWVSELPFSNQATEILLAALMAFNTLAAVQFLMRYVARRSRWLNRALPIQCVVMLLTLMLAGSNWLYPVSSLWFAVLTAEALTASGYHLWVSRQQRSPHFWPMASLLALVLLSMLLELVSQWLPLDNRVVHVAQLLPGLGFMALGLRLVQQFGRAYQTAEQNRAELEVRIREATAQIERNFAQLSELKVEQVTDRERKRIAADLHDDLGAKLLTIVHTSDNDRISTLAREALEEMRLSVRGLTGKPVKLVDALGDWRAEVISRLSQTGVQGEWKAPSDEDVPHTLSSRAFVQTTRILREAVSNIIKHSGASQCSVTCTIADGDFQLVIQDNGHGIPMELDGRLDKGHGMASMKGRAKQLQGQCLVESGPGYGTVIRLTLPLERHTTLS